MKKVFIIFLFLIAVLKIPAQYSNDKYIPAPKPVVLIDQLKMPAMILVWYDKFGDEHSIKPCGTVNKKFGLNRILKIDKPTLFILPIGNQIPFLIFPGDTVRFYNGDKLSAFKDVGNPTLKYKSPGKNSNQLKFFETVFDSLGSCFGILSYSTPKNITSIRGAFDYHFNKYQKRISFLDSRFKRKDLNQAHYKYIQSYFKCKFYDDVFSSFQSRRFPDSLSKSKAIKIADSLASNLNYTENLSTAWYRA